MYNMPRHRYGQVQILPIRRKSTVGNQDVAHQGAAVKTRRVERDAVNRRRVMDYTRITAVINPAGGNKRADKSTACDLDVFA
jgi:hypothetical protein